MQRLLSGADTDTFKAEVNVLLAEGWSVVPESIKPTDIGGFPHLALVIEKSALAAPVEQRVRGADPREPLIEVVRLLDELIALDGFPRDSVKNCVSSLLRGKVWKTAADLTVSELERCKAVWVNRHECRALFDLMWRSNVHPTFGDKEFVLGLLNDCGVDVTEFWQVTKSQWDKAILALPDVLKRLGSQTAIKAELEDDDGEINPFDMTEEI
jgi:hypothetical protein